MAKRKKSKAETRAPRAVELPRVVFEVDADAAQLGDGDDAIEALAVFLVDAYYEERAQA